MRKHLAKIGLALVLVLAAAELPAGTASAAEQPKKHQATGTIASINATKVTLNKRFGRNTTEWDFTIPARIIVPLGLSKGKRVTVYYHEDKNQRIVERIKLTGSAAAPGGPTGNKETKSTASP